MSEETSVAIRLPELQELGSLLAKSGYFQDAKDMAQAVVKVLAGKELGIPPVASMTGINIITGRVSLSANLMASCVKRSGKYNYIVKELTDTACEIHYFEGKEQIGVSRFDLGDAKRAETKNMQKFPRNMLFARAMSNGAKWYCADVFGGPVYTPEELGAKVDERGEVIEISTTIPMPKSKLEAAKEKVETGEAEGTIDVTPEEETKRDPDPNADLAAEVRAREEAEEREAKEPPAKLDRNAIWKKVLDRAKNQKMTTGAVLLALTGKGNMPDLSDAECLELKKKLEG